MFNYPNSPITCLSSEPLNTASTSALRLKPALATVSLGNPTIHPLTEKLDATAQNGFLGVELFDEDLKQVTRELYENLTDLPSEAMTEIEEWALDLEAARIIRDLCDDRNLEIVSLQPFRHYEGLLDPAERERRKRELEHWIHIARALGDDVLILIPSSFLDATQTTGDRKTLIADLTFAADLAYPVRIAYEALAWGTHVNTWEHAWKIVSLVDRKNFGLCLDTFNIAALIWPDPMGSSGTLSKDSDRILRKSLRQLVQEVDPSRIFVIQLADGEQVDPSSPFLHVPGQSKLMGWSRNARLFPFEEDRGGCLPISDIAKSLLNELSFSGWVSMEIFSRTTASLNPIVPWEHAARAARSWQKVLKVVG